MSKLFSISALTITAALAVVCTQSAAAADDNSWKKMNFTTAFTGNAVYVKERNIPFSGEMIYMGNAQKPGLALICLRGKFTVTAALEPTDFRELFKQSTLRHKQKSVAMKLDDKLVYDDPWIYRPSLKVVIPHKKRARSTAAKIYNAAIKSQKLALKPSMKKLVEYDLPKPNQAFAEFGADCGIGKNAKK